MRRDSLVKHRMSSFVSVLLGLLMALAVMPTAVLAGEAQVQRLIDAMKGEPI